MNEMLEKWHRFVETKDAAILEEILAGDVKFHSPFVWKPKDGRAAAIVILKTVATVFEDFRYLREIVGERDCALEFEARVGEFTLRGVDLMRIGDDGKIVDFEVMVRPANGLQALGAEMSRRLNQPDER
ncbi:MAG: nuclear transport factor 2 family protein [Acidobacteria bacterium]|nr:nuclear transport factor 2 family protein [Acidobacteriota bacterium]